MYTITTLPFRLSGGDEEKRTSTAPVTSLPDLHFPSPSTTAPTASSTYFSKLSASISFSIPVTANEVWREDRRRVRRDVCRFNEVSSFAERAPKNSGQNRRRHETVHVKHTRRDDKWGKVEGTKL